ncbi:MAG: DNA methyltransferase [Nocardioidaceae bacterium]|nr:MAG: DNA methyltransferase [Nocardioidaceae bacterium]
MTFKSNMGVGRHGWLRLTPAYGVRLVRDRISHLPAGSVITDPFSGTGTTPLAAAELGHFGQSVDVNPFLIWLGQAKVRHYAEDELLSTVDAGRAVANAAQRTDRDTDLWQPNLFKIEKWWSAGKLHALKALRAAIDEYSEGVRDLMDLALCRTLIAASNAAFNHQSMSFKDPSAEDALFNVDEFDTTIQLFTAELATIVESAQFDLTGQAEIHHGDSREGITNLKEADLVLTSPPYVNRMSYIRELRPYMYWLRFLDQASDAGDLDWRAIGGTWGTATSKLNSWKPEVETPIDDQIAEVAARIAADGGKNGPLLATYVHKYHHDMWQHFVATKPMVKVGGRVSYIIGNSTFYEHEVPAHSWYADMLRALDFTEVEAEVIRKRNSNKALFEYDVRGVRT